MYVSPVVLVVSVHCPLSSLFRMQSRQCLSWETWIWIWYSSDIPFKLELGLGWDQRTRSGQCRNTRRLGEGTNIKNHTVFSGGRKLAWWPTIYFLQRTRLAHMFFHDFAALLEHLSNFYQFYWAKTTVFLSIEQAFKEFCKKIINFLSSALTKIDHSWLNAKLLPRRCTVWPYHVVLKKPKLPIYSQILHKNACNKMNKIKQNIHIRFTNYMLSKNSGLPSTSNVQFWVHVQSSCLIFLQSVTSDVLLLSSGSWAQAISVYTPALSSCCIDLQFPHLNDDK